MERVRELRLERPNERQEVFLRDRHKYVAFGGARGGGKSWAVRTKAVLLALRYPGIRLLLVRRTYQELENNHIRFLRAQLAGIAAYRAAERRFVFPGGSTLEFGYCACDGDLDRYQGAEYDVIFIDEATQLREEWMRQFAACLRGVNGFPKRIYYTCNPGGPGHGYIKRLFIDRCYEDGERAEDYAFIPAKVTDNKALLRSQPDYLRQLEALPPKLRAAWLEGKWDLFEGQFFQEFVNDPAHYGDRRFTHVIAPFDIPREWTVCRSYDFGYAKPFSCAWWAVDFDGCIYRILELYGCTATPNEGVRWTPDRQFEEIRKIERTHPWLKGRSIQGWPTRPSGTAHAGEHLRDGASAAGLLHEGGQPPDSGLDADALPDGLLTRRGTRSCMCSRTVGHSFGRSRGCCSPETEPEDLDTRQEDDVADESRYFCMSRPIAPPRRGAGKKPADDPLNQRAGRCGSWQGLVRSDQ